ncbi:hypothetical protein CK203_100247 [Vitis vinifera]|uniref:Uncharacterized protein n=1 Tax=Vitis vinifera TaxID=29760 RepID=A0A438FID6_VITVI|nr:hypothetical protein CK203_100247 [Vitis vinifera]
MIAMVQMRLHAFLYTSSPFITAMSITTFLVLSLFGFLEMLGIHLQYSKLWNVNSRRSSIKVSSTVGMLFLYTPAFLFGLSSFGLFPDYDFRCGLVASALTVHFLKRILEVLFIHKYSGGMVLDSGIVISLSYFTSTATTIYSQHIVQGSMEPPIDLKSLGFYYF